MQEWLHECATMFGWRYCHFHDSRREVVTKTGKRILVGDKDAAGFPDTVLVRGDNLIFAECKKELGKVEPTQQAWIDDLKKVKGVEAYVWRPSDREYIRERLSTPAHDERIWKAILS